MAKRILVIVVVLIVAGFFYLGYHNYDAGRAAASGDVTPRPSTTEPNSDDADTKPSAPPAASAPAQSSVLSSTTGQVARPGSNDTGTATPSASDTISPNPPNGMIFSGTGHFQLYRQGNLTWRLNTDTGQSCILFATDEEWKKSKVYKAGCGKT